MYSHYQNYDFWCKNASRYDIRKVLQFCGNEQYIRQAALSIPKFNMGAEVRDPLKAELVARTFAEKFTELPELYQNAILRNPNISDDFFNKIIKKINWYIFVENSHVSFDFFVRNKTKLHAKWCRNPKMRRDVFDLLGGATAIVPVEDKMHSPNFSDAAVESISCTTPAEQAAYVDRFVHRCCEVKRVQSKPGNSYQFWKAQFSMAPDLVALFCDDGNFMENNRELLNWKYLSANPNSSEILLGYKIDEIDTHLLITRWGAPAQLIRRLHRMDRINTRDLYLWCRAQRSQKIVLSELDKTFFGNVLVHDPSGQGRDGSRPVIVPAPVVPVPVVPVPVVPVPAPVVAVAPAKLPVVDDDMKDFEE